MITARFRTPVDPETVAPSAHTVDKDTNITTVFIFYRNVFTDKTSLVHTSQLCDITACYVEET